MPLFGGRIVVGAISPGGAADILMTADNSIRNQDYAGSTRGDPNADWPTFEFRNTLSDVTIVNLAAFDLVIEGVRVVDNGTSRNPRVVLFGLNGGQISTYENPVSLEFDLRLGVVASSYVDIEQRSATPKVLEIAGVIDNPIGLTRLVNLNGAITATGTGRVITNQLDAYAPSTTLGSIGSATARLAVDLVRYRAFPTLTDTVGGFFDPRLVVDAGVDAFLSLRGVDRTGTFTGSITTSSANLTRAAGTGTWADDGFVVGDQITVFGLAGGSRIYQVTSVVGTTLGIQLVSGGGGLPGTGTATLSVVRRVPMTIAIDHVQAGQDVNLELRTTVRQPGGATGGFVDVSVPLEFFGSFWGLASGNIHGLPHQYHFRGANSLTPSVYDPAPTNGTAPRTGNGTITTGDEVQIDGAYVIHLGNVIAARVAQPFNTVQRFAADAAGGGRFTLFTTTVTPLDAGGIDAGRNLSIKDTEGLTSGLAPDSGSIPRISVRGWIEIRDVTPGLLDVNVDGAVNLVELTGDMRVGLVRSRTDDVLLRSIDGSILDADPADHLADADPQDVEGVNIGLVAGVNIGTGADFLEINLLNNVNGVEVAGRINAQAQHGVYLEEVAGDMRVWFIAAVLGDPTYESDLVLVSRTGGIYDAQSDSENDLFGNRIDLMAATGIGLITNALEINSSTNGRGSGRLYATAGSGIVITETIGELSVLAATTLDGVVFLTVPDINAPRGPPPGVGEDLILISTGTRLVHQGDPESVGPSTGTFDARAGIWARGLILLHVGDNVEALAGTEIVGGSIIQIYGDYGNADPGVGTLMQFGGRVGGVFDLDGTPTKTGTTFIYGNVDDDRVEFLSTFLGTQTRVYGSNSPTSVGPDGNDVFIVDQIQTMDVAAGDTLFIDGREDHDEYVVYTTGSRGPERNYIVNVLDSGVGGLDNLSIYGVDGLPEDVVDDVFLLRRITAIPGFLGFETANGPAMANLLHGSLDSLRRPDGLASSTNQQRVNYDTAIDGLLTVDGRGGNDVFASDDVSAVTVIVGGAGNDTFQIGQLYGSPRIVPNVLAPNVFPLTYHVTHSWLSPGNTLPLTVNGGDGDDDFTVYNNQDTLTLNGQAGNDHFTVRSFLDFDTGQYIVKAVIAIDGGVGVNDLLVIGTERDDAIAIDRLRIVGAGNNIFGANLQILVVDAMEADDDIYVQATNPGTATTVYGGLGSDTINVTGDVVRPLVPDIAFPVVPHVLTNIAGPLTAVGGEGPARPLIAAIKLPGELDAPFGPTPVPPSEALQIDVLNIYDDGRSTNATGTLTSTGFTWTGSAGITFGDPLTGLTEFERLNLLLGRGNDVLAVTGTLVNVDDRVTLTVIHGGGGSDAITVTGGGGPVTQLVVYGDTSQDGAWYAGGTAGIDAGAKPFGGGRFLFPVGVPFSNPGNDFINAEALFVDAAPGALPTLGIIAYGGAGNDIILGTQAADMLLGGSGDDEIHGERGPDRIWGDSGLIVGVIDLSRTIVTANTAST